ncbi:hypothetical protein [Nocardia sp. IFM 10818]
MTVEHLKKLIDRAAGAVEREWPGVIDAEDLAQELWVWILERPSVQKKFAESNDYLIYRLLTRHGNAIASEAASNRHRFAGTVFYGSEEVRQALKGNALSHDLIDDLEPAMETLKATNPRYADALRRRFGEREKGVDKHDVYRAVLALTEEMNRVARARRAEHEEGPGTRPVLSNATAQAVTGGEW